MYKIMDQITIKIPNPICRLYWFLKGCCLALTFSLVHLPPFPVWKSIGVCIHTVCNGGGGRGSGCVESIYKSYTLCNWPDSKPTKLLYHRKQNLGRGGGPQTDKHLPPSLWSKSRHLGFGVFIDIWSMHGMNLSNVGENGQFSTNILSRRWHFTIPLFVSPT